MVSSRSIVAAVAATLVGSVAAAPNPISANIHRRNTPTGSSDNTNVCTPLELVSFRSAEEGQGPSLGFFGDPFYAELKKYVPDASAYNVNFLSTVYEEFLTNLQAGIDATAWINKRSKQCPNQRYIVIGYSKGTIGVHQTYPANPGRQRVVASLVAGDWMHRNAYLPPAAFNTSWPSNGDYSIRSLCNVNDLICQQGGTDQEIHFAPHYIPYIPDSVQWALGLYQRNLVAPFKYQWTLANH